MRMASRLIEQLKARIAQGRVGEAEFTVALAEIIASTPDQIAASDSLLLAQEIRGLETDWRTSEGRRAN